MIKLENVYVSFGNMPILSGINLDVAKGEKIVIIGPSGCGKSTLLRLILGLKTPDKGDVWFDGDNVARLSKQALRKRRLKMGMLFQSAALFDSMTVSENVGFSLTENYRMPLTDVNEKVAHLLDMVDMSGFEDALPSELSGGQKKRIGLARAIAASPDAIFYDEPTTGLDPILSTSIEDVIVKLNTQLNATSIVVSHQKSTILRTGDKIYMMHNGQLLMPETPERIENSDNPVIRRFIRGENKT